MNARAETSVHTIDIGTLADIPERGARRVHANGKTIAVFRTASDAVFALEDKCPHKQGPLSQGIVHGDCVTCPLHNWVFSLESGEAQGADSGSVDVYPVQVRDDRIILSLIARDSEDGS